MPTYRVAARVATMFLAVLGLAACRSTAVRPPAPMPAPEAATGINLQVPSAVGEFVMRQRHDYDDPADGVMLRFVRPDSLVADVFLYPGPDLGSRCALPCARDEMRREIGEFVAVIPELIRRKYVDTLSVAGDDSLVPSASDAWRLGRHLTLRETAKGKAQSSDFYLYYLPGFRVKVRASYPPDSERTAAVARFAAAIVPALLSAPAPEAAAASADDQHIMVSVTLAGPAAATRDRVVATLASLGYTLTDSGVVSDNGRRRIVTAPRLTWPKGSESESWHGAESPGVMLVVTLRDRADSTAVEIGGRSPTRAGWREAKVAQTLELLSVMELAAALDDKKKSPAGP